MAAPRVLTMMEEARSNSFKTEAGSIIDGAKLAYAQDALDGGSSDGCFRITKTEGEKTVADYMDKNWEGYSGFVKIDTDGSDHTIWITNGSYLISGGTAGALYVKKIETADDRTIAGQIEAMTDCTTNLPTEVVDPDSRNQE